MNRLTVSNGKLLVSGGALNIKVMNADTLVDITKGDGIYISSPVLDGLTVNNVFFGEETDPGFFNWVKYSNSLHRNTLLWQQVYNVYRPGMGFKAATL